MSNKVDKYGFRFRQWDVYRDSLLFRKQLNTLIKKFPSDEKYILVDQTKRASTSVTLNISEGSNKLSDKETGLYINRARCSVDEIVGCFDLAHLEEYITASELHLSLTNAESLCRRLQAFTGALRKGSQ